MVKYNYVPGVTIEILCCLERAASYFLFPPTSRLPTSRWVESGRSSQSKCPPRETTKVHNRSVSRLLSPELVTLSPLKICLIETRLKPETGSRVLQRDDWTTQSCLTTGISCSSDASWSSLSSLSCPARQWVTADERYVFCVAPPVLRRSSTYKILIDWWRHYFGFFTGLLCDENPFWTLKCISIS